MSAEADRNREDWHEVFRQQATLLREADERIALLEVALLKIEQMPNGDNDPVRAGAKLIATRALRESAAARDR